MSRLSPCPARHERSPCTSAPPARPATSASSTAATAEAFAVASGQAEPVPTATSLSPSTTSSLLQRDRMIHQEAVTKFHDPRVNLARSADRSNDRPCDRARETSARILPHGRLDEEVTQWGSGSRSLPE